MMREGVQFDAARGVIDEEGQIFIFDGLHRGEAAKQVGVLLPVEVRPGSREEAEWLALTANQKHGLRRTRADKQRIARGALLHPRGANLSDREIARHCGVDHKTVGKLRRELETSGEIPRIDKRTVTRNGQVYQQNTGRIGQPETAPEPGPSSSLPLPAAACATCSPYAGSNGKQAPLQPKAQEFECPRCGRERIVGVNGSRRWCLHCGAEWPTTAAFLAEVEGNQVWVKTAAGLQQRFSALVAGAEPEQLDKLDTWLTELEKEFLPEKRKA